MAICPIVVEIFESGTNCEPYSYTAWLKIIKNVTTLLCKALTQYCLVGYFVRCVTYEELCLGGNIKYLHLFTLISIYNYFSADKDDTALIPALFWDAGCYFDRNTLPRLALTALVVKLVWICCHVVPFCSNYSQLIGRGKGLFQPLCQMSCWQGMLRHHPSFAWTVKLQKEIMDTHHCEDCVPWELFSKSSYTPDFQYYLSAPLLIVM